MKIHEDLKHNVKKVLDVFHHASQGNLNFTTETSILLVTVF